MTSICLLTRRSNQSYIQSRGTREPFVPAQADAARRLGLTEGAAKVAIHRLRKRFRELVRTEITQTVEDATQVQDELRYLLEVLSQP